MSAARRRFRFIKEIAEGGFGKVYLAEQLSQDGFSRIVAIKLLHAKWSSHDEVVMRTRDEARLLGLVRHQNIVKVEDLTSIDGKCAIVMEYLEGVDLKAMSAYLLEREMDFPKQAMFEVFIGVASAIDTAYNGEPLQGGEPLRVIHRDIKPSNIFVTVNASIKVLDFGTARANFAEREAKTQALAFGSQGYMAPERMLGEEDTPAADVFSLGVTLYELLAGESFGRIPPRPNKFVAKVEERIGALALDGDEEWNEQVRETLRLMMAYEPSERPTARQLVDIFELLAQNAPGMPLRRFARTLVAEAKASQPELDTGDPLTGQIVDEDLSSMWQMGAGDAPTVATGESPSIDPFQADAVPEPTAGGIMGLEQAMSSGAATARATPAPAPSAEGPPSPAALSGSSEAGPAMSLPSKPPPPPPAAGEADEPPKRSRSMLTWILVAAGVLVFLGLGMVGLAVVALVMLQGDGQLPFAMGDGEPAAEVAEVSKVELPDGGKVTSKDERDDAPRSIKTVLKLEGVDAALVEIRGGLGFEAEWDGKGEFDLGPLGEGRYKANITPASGDLAGDKIRNKSFKVVAGKTCSYTFVVAKKRWNGKCS